jgi:tetrathionate reductase subunit C
VQIIELLTPAYEAAWLPWAVQYFFLIGICATTALTAAFASFAPSGSQANRLMPALVAVLLVSALSAPISLLADLHQPGRFWHFYAHVTPWSWMSIGALLLPVFISATVLFALAWWLANRTLLRIMAALMAVAAASVLVYTGAEVMEVRSRVLWNTPFLPINFALTGWLAALGAVFLVGRWLPGGQQSLPNALLKKLGLCAAGLLALSASAWAALGLMGKDAAFTEAVRLFELFPVWRLSLFGSILAGGLIVALLMAPSRRLADPGYSALVALMMLAAAWTFRWVIFMGVQGVPKYGAGLYLYSMPLGGDGLMGMLGILGLCAALVALISLAFDLAPPKSTNFVAPPPAGH